MKDGLSHTWPMSPFMFTSIDYLKIKRDFRGAGRVQKLLFSCRRQCDKKLSNGIMVNIQLQCFSI
ncbi:TPA: hypothetical protein I7742_21095 [Vibrio vulnificus]|nr:hypothetical protein [Vibrio vulnificus]HAS8371592.1 hypothetical protein [Vibrio vulnificus]